MWRLPAVAAALLVAASVTFLLSTPALAHERREVGPYQLVVGFLAEPAFAATVNGVDLRVTDTRTDPATPVEGLQDTLRVEIFHAGLTDPLELEFRARFGQAGAYAADFIPTRAGEYAFRIVGTIGDLDVDERFESGPDTFSSVEAPAELQYPDTVPVGAELSERIAGLERDLGTARAMAIGALGLAVVLPLVLTRVVSRR